MIYRRNLELPKVTQSKMDLLFNINQVANEINNEVQVPKLDYTIGSLGTFRKHFSNKRPTETTLDNLGSLISSEDRCSPVWRLSGNATLAEDHCVSHDVAVVNTLEREDSPFLKVTMQEFDSPAQSKIKV